MQYSPGKGALALIVALMVVASGSAFAQDTTETGRAAIDTTALDTGASDTAEPDTSSVRDTTDTSGVLNPQGYRGMERDTTIFPDSGSSAAGAGAVEDQTTGTYEDSTGAAGTTQVGDTEPKEENTATPRLDPSESSAGGDTAGVTPDSTQ